MQLDMKLGNKQVLRQQLSLNADMLQSLEILRLPIQQLREVMIQKSYDNPLLELEDSAQPSEAAETGPEIPAEGQDTEEVLSVQALRNDIWSAGAAGEDAYFAAGTAETSFTELLNEQVGAVEVDDAFAWLCRYLIACLDRRGYFTDAPEEVAKELCCKSFDVTQALYFIQALEPAGVGARSLEECLLLQLMRGSHFNAYTIRLVKDGLPLLADGNIAGIARLLGLDRAQTLAVCAQVRALHPIPSRGYYTGEARGTIIPDATVEKTETGFTVVYNRRLLPTLKLNAQYVDMMEASGEVQVRDYLQRNLSDARQFIRAVEKREDTFTRILTQIVLMQPQFFPMVQPLSP
ncbi:MAG: hypothetical protein LIO58_06225 [Oscillospiraceae bacterium]|nr:hypothetical protein [Oscillospiraceae bacterium]